MNQTLKLTLVLGFLSAFAPLSIDMYLSALPTMQSYFATNESHIQLTLASFFIGFSFGQLIYGPLSDRFGRKLPLYIGLIVFIIASIGCALSTSVTMLIIFRLFQALGACAGGVISRAIVRDLYHPNDAVKIYSYLMLVSSIAPMLAPILGSFILTAIGWKYIFYTLAILGVLSLLSVMFYLPSTPKQQNFEPFSPSFILKEYFLLIKHKHFIINSLIGGFSMAAMFAYITASSFIFMEIFYLSNNAYALLFGANAVVFVIAAQINARVVDKFGSNALIKYALYLLAFCIFLLILFLFLDIINIYLVVLSLMGFMFSLGFIVPNSTAMAMAPFSTNAGSASALLGTLQFSLAAISSIALGFIKANMLYSMGIIMAICAVFAILMLVYMRNLKEAIEID